MGDLTSAAIMPPSTDEIDQDPEVSMVEDDATKPWYLRDADSVIAVLDEKRDDYYKAVSVAGLVRMWRVAWAQYYGTDPDNPGEMATQQIKRVGNEREYTRARINEFRSFVKQAIQTAIGVRPAYKATTESTDFATLAGIEAIDRALAYVMLTTFPNRKRRRFLERAHVLGFSFAHCRWDAEGGDDTKWQEPVLDEHGEPMLGMGADGIPGTGEPLTEEVKGKSGAPVIGIGCPWETYFDVEEEDDLTWQVVRERRSKGELAALFPELEEEIMMMPGDDKHSRERVFAGNPFLPDTNGSNDDKLTVEHFYLARCPGAENGRYILYLPEGEGGTLLSDGELPVKAKGKLPVVNLVPSAYIGAFLGYADAWDTISIQQLLDNVVSDWASNTRAFGRAVMSVEKGSGISFEAYRKGLTVVERNPGTVPPVFVVPPEFKGQPITDYLHRRMESVTQQNAVRRGDPQANIKSGTMAALFNQQSIEFMGDIQEAFDGAETELANLEMEMIRSRSKGEFMVQVAGEGQRPYWESFSGSGLKGVRAVHVDSVSPMMRSPSGRLEVFNIVSQVPPDKVGATLRGLDKGDWSGWTDEDNAGDLRLVRENELLLRGQQVAVAALDPHEKHVPSHWAMFERLESADPSPPPPPPPELDPITGEPLGPPPPPQPPGKYEQQKAAILQHILWHGEQWQLMDPRLGALLKRPPPPPMPGTPSGDLMMMTGGMGASVGPAPGEQPPGEVPTPDAEVTSEQPDQPDPAQPPPAPKQGAAA